MLDVKVQKNVHQDHAIHSKRVKLTYVLAKRGKNEVNSLFEYTHSDDQLAGQSH